MLKKWGRRERRWCRMLKREKEGVEYGKGVETIVNGQEPMERSIIKEVGETLRGESS